MTTENAELIPGSEEYNQAMIAKARGGDVKPTDEPKDEPKDTSDVPAMPDNGQAKYYNAETGEYDWASHAKEAEYRLNQIKAGKTPDEPAEGADEGTPTEGDDTAKPTESETADVLKAAGLAEDRVLDELATLRDLSPESREALAKQGVSKAIVDMMVKGFLTQQEANDAAIYEAAGGKDEWDKLSKFIGSEYSQAEVDAFNEALMSPYAKYAIKEAQERFNKRVPGRNESRLIDGEGTTTPTQTGYRSRAEMKRDMADAKYRNDPTFQAEVAEKIRYATWDLDR